MLSAWNDFYMLLGTAAAALLALLFVAASVGTGFLSFERATGTRIYISPVVTHFTGILFGCAVGLIPILGATGLAFIYGFSAATGIGYCLFISHRVLTSSAIDLDDRICHGVVPPAAYALGLAAAVLFYQNSPHAPALLALALLLLLLVNIRNAWDLILFIVRQQTAAAAARKPDPP
jgi:hypothetical protein